MIEVRQLVREFRVGDEIVRALRGVDLDVEAGEFIALMGPSGSGKSTMLNILGCLDRPTSGSYKLRGRETATLSEDDLVLVRRHKIGFVFQTFHLIPRMTALANVELPMIFAGIRPSLRRSRAGAVLDSVGLGARTRHRPSELSGGERQRVAIARALIMNPEILLADEPTGNLDAAAGEEVMAILADLNRRGLTILVVTHNPEIARRAERVLRMRDGGLE